MLLMQSVLAVVLNYFVVDGGSSLYPHFHCVRWHHQWVHSCAICL